MVNWTFVQIFVGFGLISILVSDSDQKKSSLPAVDCYLPDNLVKTLVEQFFPHGAQTNVPRLPADKSFIKFLMQLNDLYFGGRGGEDSLDPELSIISPMFFGREYLSKDILGVVQLLIFLGFFVLVVFAGSAKEYGGGIFYQWVLLCLHCCVTYMAVL